MKQNKYIPGDWVKYIGNNSPRYVQIWQVRENSLLLEDGYGTVDFSEVEPIPLTPEILEKNGWEWDGQDFVIGALVLYPEADYFVFDGFGLKLKYVHQLQHLLFGLGLDSNFDLTDTKKGVSV